MLPSPPKITNPMSIRTGCSWITEIEKTQIKKVMQQLEWLKVIIQLNRSHALLQWHTQVNIMFVLDVYNLFPLNNNKNKWNFKNKIEKSEDIYIFCIPSIKRQ